MGLRQGDWIEWIELDNQFPKFHRIKSWRVKEYPGRCVKTAPAREGLSSGELAAKETVHELAEFLSRRYPQVYSVTRRSPAPSDFGWYGEGEIESITIVPLDVTYDLEKDDSMTVAGLLVQDDLALLLPGPDKKHYLQAGSICLAGSWRLEDKIGLPLASIHTSGDVPQYQQKLEQSMDRYFSKLQPDKLVVRHNYQFQVVADNQRAMQTSLRQNDPEELSWAESAFGDEGTYQHGGIGPAQGEQIGIATRPEEIYYRTERQTLRRLPRSGAILFTIRTYHEPVTNLAKESGVPGRLASAVRSWPPEVGSYKGLHRYKDVLLDYLDRAHDEQVAKGLDTTSSPLKYPF
ncbi:hypothetical protein FRB99_001528 [Tulasnella sp. 403]|nr:hypothetical protein FRB99_001528 [Tulasnella sp. 403]